MYRFLRARTASDDDAADLTQVAFINAYHALSQYRAERGSFAAWLFRIARNLATDAYRRRRPSISWDFVPDVLADAKTEAPEDALLRQERLEQLHTLVSRLDSSKQELLALRFAAGLSSREIGLVIGKSEEATKKQLSRAIAQLKEGYRELI